MKNRKQLLADFYLELLKIPFADPFRTKHQELYGTIRDTLAQELDSDSETVQNIFERMAAEDSQRSKAAIKCIKCDTLFLDLKSYTEHLAKAHGYIVLDSVK